MYSKRAFFTRVVLHEKLQFRRFSDKCEAGGKKGVVLGAYEGCNPGEFFLTESAIKFDDEAHGKLTALMKGVTPKKGTAQVYTNLSQEFYGVAVAGLGRKDAGYNSLEVLDECKENIRVAAGVGAQALQERGVNNIFVEAFTNAEAAAEGACLGVWKYEEHKSRELQTYSAKLDLFDSGEREAWQRGILKAESQNVARRMSEAPANLMTPSLFAKMALETLCPCGVQVEVRDRNWIENKKMQAFLSMARGSCEAPLFLEINYCAAEPEQRPVVLTGKGVTFDSGGLCLKECLGMSEHRGDMAGAAVIVGVFRAVSSMNLPINLQAAIPLCENMPGGMATKPGDVLLALNGKTIRVEDTDNEGRVILADALQHTTYWKPCLLINVATLSRELRYSLGFSASACFTTSDIVWREFSNAGADTGDRVWRMPVWKFFTESVTDYLGVDVNNTGKGGGGDPCKGAMFLTEFLPPDTDFAHLDIAGTGMTAPSIGVPYLRKGLMTGRPTRTIVQFLYQMACPHEKADEC